jgi:hypothetical protein
MTDTLKITLAGKDYSLPRLNLKQLRALSVFGAKAKMDALKEMEAREKGEGKALPDIIANAFDSNVEIVAAAMSRAYPDMTEAALFELETTNEEMLKAANEVLIFAGIVAKPEDAPTGEAEAPATTGE